MLVFVVLAYGFAPEIFSGKVLNQSDITGYRGMSREQAQWDKAHPDDPALWTGSMFGGMPTAPIHITPRGDWTQPVYNLLTSGKRPASFLLVSLLGAFLMMLAFGVSVPVAVGGAVAVTFCAYNIQIIQVGHNTKMLALAFLPWALAAFVITYRKALEEGLEGRRRLVWMLPGAVAFGLAVSLQVKANHPQISYYFAIMLVLYALVQLVSLLVRRKPRKWFWLASVMLLVTGFAGIGTNASKLLPTAEYTPWSMRGGTTQSESDGGRKGLDLDYATAWSYGWEELPNMLIANYNGGASAGELGPDSETVQLLRKYGYRNVDAVRKQLPLYWGPQPFTAGPMYMGAVTVFLFILGLMYWKGREKWWVVAASLLAILLAVGSHFMWFTRLFYDYVPLYNKFRTVSMALVVLQFTLPVLGFLMLDGMLRSGEDARVLRARVLKAGGVTAGLILLLALLQAMTGTFTGYGDAGQQQDLVEALIADRISLMWRDALRSLLLVAAAVALLAWGVSRKGRSVVTAGLLVLLVLLDLFVIDKRYLKHEDFVTEKQFKDEFKSRLVDDAILRDTDPSYRVLDLTVNVFNDSHPSYWHKNIGGYSPAKLQRYQEYVTSRLQGDIVALSGSFADARTIEEAEAAMPYLESLASLNCRYVIIGPANPPLRYRYARGNAWFEDGGGYAAMTLYSPNKLEYEVSSADGGVLVFSEIYYPVGWKAVLEDGTELPIGLYGGGADELGTVAGGLLRCVEMPAGEHVLTMSFAPPSYARGRLIATLSSIFLLLCLLAAGLLSSLHRCKL